MSFREEIDGELTTLFGGDVSIESTVSIELDRVTQHSKTVADLYVSGGGHGAVDYQEVRTSVCEMRLSYHDDQGKIWQARARVEYDRATRILGWCAMYWYTTIECTSVLLTGQVSFRVRRFGPLDVSLLRSDVNGVWEMTPETLAALDVDFYPVLAIAINDLDGFSVLVQSGTWHTLDQTNGVALLAMLVDGWQFKAVHTRPNRIVFSNVWAWDERGDVIL